ncbi:MAG: ATP-binding protein [Chloroflexota bacterium]
MTLQPRPSVILILTLVSSALIAGIIVLTLIIGANRALNRRFAMVLLAYFVGDVLAVFLWLYAAVGTSLSLEVYQTLIKLVMLAQCFGSFTVFLFTETVLDKRNLTRWAIALGGIGLVLALVIAVSSPEPMLEPGSVTPPLATTGLVSAIVGLYVIVCDTSIVVLLWQARPKLPYRLFWIGVGLFVVSQLLALIPDSQAWGLPQLFGILAALAIIVAIVRLQVFVPLNAERAKTDEERDRLLHVHEAIGGMLDEPDFQQRLRLMARSLHGLGWGQVSIALRDEKLVITEPESSVPQALVAEEEWQGRWQRSEKTLGRYRVGVGYFFPAKDEPPTNTAWQSGDALMMPLYLNNGRVAALISLTDPTDALRPTEDTVRPLAILAGQARSAIENNQLLDKVQSVAHELQDQIEELVMIQRVDKELSATLHFDNVMMLTMDWALRRTGAAAGMLTMVTRDETALLPVAALGYPLEVINAYTINSPIPLSQGIIGRATQTRKTQIAADTADDPDYYPLLPSTRSEVAVPMEIRGRLLGVLTLESDQSDAFNTSHILFIQRLAARAVVAMDNARLYREAEGRADEMAALYSAGRSISYSMERNDVLTNTAQSLAAVLNVSSAVLTDYRADRDELVVTAVYQLGTVRGATDVLPPVGHIYDLNTLPELQSAMQNHRVVTAQADDSTLPPTLTNFIASFKARAMLVAPLLIQNEVLGAVMVIESRRSREFTQDEMLMAESVASQAASALRQASLYEDVRELEKVKSEMIRMASHDLRNPLGNAMAYFEMLVSSLNEAPSEAQTEYIQYIQNSTNTIKTLIEDLLTLERIESEVRADWKRFDFRELVEDAVEAQQPAAVYKHQALSLKIDVAEDIMLDVFGSATQLRQAVANFVSNAIKYTPDDGHIEVTLIQKAGRLVFEVSDDGYGISRERQGRLFQRFYRAREPVTDHITGTGLGLSLVKTVIERHGGEVWVQSELGQGSTFGFSLVAAGKQETVPA